MGSHLDLKGKIMPFHCYAMYPQKIIQLGKKKSGIRYLTQSLESSKETQTSRSVPSNYAALFDSANTVFASAP